MTIETLREHMRATDALVADISREMSDEYLPLIQAAMARLTEVQAFVEIAAEVRPPASGLLSRLDLVLRETIAAAAHAVNTAGVNTQDGMHIDELDEFLSRQEQASLALDQAKIAATSVIVHLDRAIKAASHG